jgi:hypothetical protein
MVRRRGGSTAAFGFSLDDSAGAGAGGAAWSSAVSPYKSRTINHRTIQGTSGATVRLQVAQLYAIYRGTHPSIEEQIGLLPSPVST